MPEIPNVDSWMQVVAFLGILGYLAFKAWLDSGRVKRTAEKVDTLESTLTTTNGGSHVKDQLNRIEKGLTSVQDEVGKVGDRVTVLEQRRGFFGR